MSLADCPKCWDVLCSCGWEYKDWSIDRLKDLIKRLEKVKEYKIANPPVKSYPLRSPIVNEEKFWDFLSR